MCLNDNQVKQKLQILGESNFINIFGENTDKFNNKKQFQSNLMWLNDSDRKLIFAFMIEQTENYFGYNFPIWLSDQNGIVFKFF